MSNDINLAALWVPVMPETSKVEPEMKKAGEQGRKAFFQGMTGSGGGGGSDSPENIGRSWAQQMVRSFQSTFAGQDFMPRQTRDFMESLGAETKTTERQMARLKDQVKETFGAFDTSARQALKAEQELLSLTREYNRALEQGNTKLANNFYGPQVQQATTKYRAAVQDVQAKQTSFIGSTDKLNAAQGKTATASMAAAGAMGALAGVVATMGLELATELFKKMAEAVAEVAKFVLESGEAFESQSRQIKMFTDATGDDLTRLESTAIRVFGEIDTKGENLGETVGILGSRFKDLSDEQLARLSRHVEELSGRFGNLNVRELVTMFGDLGVTGDQADATLAMMLEKARGANMALPDMVSAMAGASSTLAEMGLNAEQAATMIAGLESKGTSAATTINQLQTAQKEFTEQGWSFSEGMQKAGERLQFLIDTGQEAEATEFARTVFGSRRWIDAKTAVDEYNNAIAQQPGLYDENGTAIDDFIEQTQSLADKWQEVKNKAIEVLAPLGMLILDKLGGALDKAKEYIENNSEAIRKRIKGIGHAFIESLPMIRDFTAASVVMLGMLADAINVSLIIPLRQAAGWAQMAMGAATLNWDMVKKGMSEVADSALALADPTKYSRMAAGFAKEIADIELPTNDWHREWDEFVNDIGNTDLKPTVTPQISIGNSLGTPGGIGPSGGIPSLPGILNGGNAPSTLPGMLNPGGSGPGGPVVGPSGSTTVPLTPSALGQALFGPGGAGSASGAMSWQNMLVPNANVNVGPGAEAWRPAVEKVVAQYGPLLGIAGEAQKLWVDAIVKQIQSESGGDPTSVNPNDSNGRGGTQRVAGLLNFLESTYNANNITGRPYMDPLGQIAAVLPYVLGKYGTDQNGGPNVIGRGSGFTEGGTVPGERSATGSVLMPPNARDTVPLWAEPGEEVVNVKASNMFRPLLKMMNAQGLNTGGTVRYSPSDGVGAGTSINYGQPGFPPWVYQLASQFGLQASTYPGHQSGFGIDWAGPVANMDAFAKALVSSGGMPQVIWMNPSTGQKVGMANGQMVGPGTSQPGYYRNDWAGHTDHVHTRWPPAAYNNFGIGDTTGAVDPTGAIGPAGPMFPGLPGQYGGYGTYGAQDWESVARNEKAMRQAQQKIDDANYAISQKEQQIRDLEKIAADVRKETNVWGKTDPEKVAKADKDVEDAKHDLAVAIRERDDDQIDYNTVARKAQEDAMKPPSTKGKGSGAQQDRYGPLWSQLGGSLLGGLAESVGLDMFGKPPWEWGSVKLLASLANWGVGTANAWGDFIGAGKTGLTGFQPIPGWDDGGGMLNMFSGAAGSVGINLPNLPGINSFGATTAPNVAVNPNTQSHGLGLGQPPGPVVDNSINVTNNGPKQSDYDTWKNAQNTRTAPQMASMPRPMG